MHAFPDLHQASISTLHLPLFLWLTMLVISLCKSWRSFISLVTNPTLKLITYTNLQVISGTNFSNIFLLNNIKHQYCNYHNEKRVKSIHSSFHHGYGGVWSTVTKMMRKNSHAFKQNHSVVSIVESFWLTKCLADKTFCKAFTSAWKPEEAITHFSALWRNNRNLSSHP